MTRASAIAVLLGCIATSLAAQGSPSPDYSQEAFIVESSRLAYRFENDGTGRRDLQARIRVQSDGGVQQWGQLVFGYNAATERLDIETVRVHKMDGTVVTAPAAAVQELSSPVARDAPIYTDFRQKHVTVPSLRPGETLEFRVVVTMHTSLAAGHFWTEHDFQTAGVVLDEALEIDVPAARAVTLLTAPGRDPVISEADGRRVYRWTTSHKTPTRSVSDVEAEADAAGEPAAVRLTTFRSWEEVAAWYAGIEKGSRAATPELRAKAEDLTAGRRTDLEKLEALYDFVALNFRYVSISLGAGRYQPRAAADVLRDQYGDCKDKHTLLASLMESIGLQASTVLIGSATPLDPAFPSPSQFDHVITRTEVGGDPVWLDVTTEVAPFRLLSPTLRKKQALVVRTGTGGLEETPADPPFPSAQSWTIDGRLGDLGTLTAHVTYSLRGDMELALRPLFRAVPSARWKDLLVELNEGSGVGGEIGAWKVSDPAATKEPFTFEYDVTKVGFVDWTKRTAAMRLPFSSIVLPEPTGDAAPITLGAPETMAYRLRLELAPGYTARLPVPVDVARDYGDYHAAYTLSGRLFAAERSLTTRARELPGGRSADYAAFRRVIAADMGQPLGLDIPATAAAGAGAGGDLRTEDLLRSAMEALRAGNTAQAIPLLTRVVEAEPKHATAWRTLAAAHAAANNVEGAIEALRAQIAIDPFDERAYTSLGTAYLAQRKYDDAEAAFKKQLEVNPLDSAAPQMLGQLYMEVKRFEEAIPHLERAATRDSDNPGAHVSRGRAYLHVGRSEDALAAFDRAIELSPTPTVWNNVAYYLSEKGAHLDRAQRYAESAVTSVAAESRVFTLDRLTARDLSVMASLASYWDTLGWVAVARGDLARAEALLTAAWWLSEAAVIGEHLAQTYEKQGRRDLARATYAAVLATARPDPATRTRLRALSASDDEVRALETEHRNASHTMRAIAVKGSGATGEATVRVLLGAAGLENVAFVSGDDGLRGTLANVRAADFSRHLPVPDAVSAKLIREGRLYCRAADRCELVLLRLQDVKPAP
jgi:tetratricopeptide (TPR) repeat protein